MDRETLLLAVTEAAASGTVSEHDLLQAHKRGRGEITQPTRSKLSIVNILYAIGAAIVFIGIILFFRQQWGILSSSARILITLGSGISAYVVGVLISRAPSFRGVASAFFLIFLLLTPFGIFITLTTLHYRPDTVGYSDIIYSIMLIWTIVSAAVFRSSFFRVFSVIFGSLLYFSVTHTLLQGSSWNTAHMLEYRFLLLGISYLFIAYGWRNTLRSLSSWMYGFGTFFFLGAALALGGYAPDANQLWEVLFIGISFGMMFLSIFLKSRAVLVISSLYVMAYILKITAEYFSDTIGWPLSLIAAGFALIAIGYATFSINRKYLKKESSAIPAG